MMQLLHFEKVKNIMDGSGIITISWLSNIDTENIKNKIGIEIIYAEENICKVNSKTIPNRCGAYIITTKTGKRYIGMSSNMYNRIITHSLG